MTNKNDLIEAFDNLFIDLRIDSEFYKIIESFVYKWANKNDDHIEFLGGNTIGVQVVRFSVQDDRIFYDNFNINYEDIKDKILKVKGIDKTRKVASNPHYLTLMYFIYRTYDSKILSEEMKLKLIKYIYTIFAYRVISGRLTHYFKYPLDPEVAKTVTEKLSNRFILKKMGSWNKLIEYRTKDVLPGGLHYKTLNTLEIEPIQKTVADLFIRIKDVFKNIYKVIIAVLDSNNIIKSENKIENIKDTDPHYKDTINLDSYIVYIKSILYNHNDLIIPDLVKLVSLRVYNMNSDFLITGLKNLGTIDHNDLDYIIDYIIPMMFGVISKKGITSNFKQNILTIIDLLRGYVATNTIQDNILQGTKSILIDYFESIIETKLNRDIYYKLTYSLLVYLFVRILYKETE